MSKRLGDMKNIFYFDVCGQVNTVKTIELAIKRACELDIKNLVVASETGLSAVEALKKLQNSRIELIVVTSAAGTKIENTVIGHLRIGIPDEKIWKHLQESDVKIVRATDPLYNIGAPLEHEEVYTLATVVRRSLKFISSGTAVCVAITLMATDNGVLDAGEEVVAVAGSWVGLDTAVVLKATNSVDLFKPSHMEIREIICKPRIPAYSWPINHKDWVGDLKSYQRFTE